MLHAPHSRPLPTLPPPPRRRRAAARPLLRRERRRGPDHPPLGEDRLDQAEAKGAGRHGLVPAVRPVHDPRRGGEQVGARLERREKRGEEIRLDPHVVVEQHHVAVARRGDPRVDRRREPLVRGARQQADGRVRRADPVGRCRRGCRRPRRSSPLRRDAARAPPPRTAGSARGSPGRSRSGSRWRQDEPVQLLPGRRARPAQPRRCETTFLASSPASTAVRHRPNPTRAKSSGLTGTRNRAPSP